MKMLRLPGFMLHASVPGETSNRKKMFRKEWLSDGLTAEPSRRLRQRRVVKKSPKRSFKFTTRGPSKRSTNVSSTRP